MLDETKNCKEQIKTLQASIEQLDNFTNNLKTNRNQKNIFDKKKLDRSVTVELIKQSIQRWQQVSGINYLSITMGETKPHHADLIETNIRLELSALRDNDFYQFLANLENNLPTITIIKGFSLRKLHPIDRQALMSITNGEKVNIFEGWVALSLIYPK